jgi:hypothetical protein
VNKGVTAMGDDDSLESVDGQTAGGDRMSMMLAESCDYGHNKKVMISLAVELRCTHQLGIAPA